MTPQLSPFAGLLQIAYVTNDIDQAIAVFAERHKVPNWAVMRDHDINTRPGQNATMQIALAFVGPLQLELLQPSGGDDAIYREALPASGFALHHHHFAQLIDSEAAFEQQRRDMLAQGAGPLRMDGEAAGMARYFYVDQRATLGHYTEHIWYSPEGLAAMQHVPRN